MAKNIYHSALEKMGDLWVTVKSDIMNSKYGKGKEYVILEIDGEDRSYTLENPSCGDVFDGQKGEQLTIRAEGRGSDATIVALAPDGRQYESQPRQQQRRQSPPPRQQGNRGQYQRRQYQVDEGDNARSMPRGNQPPRNNQPEQQPRSNKIDGQTVGMAVKEAIGIIRDIKKETFGDEAMAYFKSVNFSRDLGIIASDIIRVSSVIQNGKIAPSPKQRMEQAADQPPQDAPNDSAPQQTMQELIAAEEIPF